MDQTSHQTFTTDRMSSTCHAIALWARRSACEDDAVTAIEYGLLAALIAVVCVVAFQATGTSLAALYEFWSSAVSAAL